MNYTIFRTYEIDQTQIEILFEGKAIKNPKECMDQLDAYFANLKSLNHLPIIIAILRTILKDIEEIKLNINIYNKNKKITIEYDHKKLNSLKIYEKIREEDNEENYQVLKSSYHIQKGFSINLNEKKLKSLDFQRKFADILQLLTSLNSYFNIILDGEKMLLCQSYQLFYQENPDFNQKETKLKFHIMEYILSYFDMALTNYRFTWDKVTSIPLAASLEFQINEISFLGEIKDITEPDNYILPERISLIGKIIRETATSLEDLKRICNLLYVLNTNETKEIPKQIEYNKEELEAVKRLSRKINIKLREKK